MKVEASESLLKKVAFGVRLYGNTLKLLGHATIEIMNLIIVIIVAIVAFAVGYFFARRKGNGWIAKQSKKKAQNKEKILEFLRKNGKINNTEVEELTGVSDATATRYLDALEDKEQIRQIGRTGRHVYYEKT